MKIGLVLEEFSPGRGGLEQWTFQFARRLRDLDHEVHVVTKRLAFCGDSLGLVPHVLGDIRGREEFARAAEAKARSLGVDIVHDMGAGWHCDVFQPHGGSWLALHRRKLDLLPQWRRWLKRGFCRVAPRYREFARIAERQYAPHARFALALSRQVARDLTELHGMPADRIRLVYNGVDTDRFRPELRGVHRDAVRRMLGIPPSDVLLLTVAHNFRLKGVPSALRTVARLRAQGRPVTLVVVGGKRIGGWQTWAWRMGIASSVRFVGSIEDVVPYYAAADVYLHPTFYDTCSLVVLEALASGVPVVTTSFNGVSELITDGREGFMVDAPDDETMLADRIDRLLEPNRRQAMGRAARRLAEERNFQRNADEVLAVYDEVLEERRHRERLVFGGFVVKQWQAAEPTVPRTASASESARDGQEVLR